MAYARFCRPVVRQVILIGYDPAFHGLCAPEKAVLKRLFFFPTIGDPFKEAHPDGPKAWSLQRSTASSLQHRAGYQPGSARLGDPLSLNESGSSRPSMLTPAIAGDWRAMPPRPTTTLHHWCYLSTRRLWITLLVFQDRSLLPLRIERQRGLLHLRTRGRPTGNSVAEHFIRMCGSRLRPGVMQLIANRGKPRMLRLLINGDG
jgi:hypothetical protein